MLTQRTLLIASDCDSTIALAKSLDADLLALPGFDEPDKFEAWRDQASAGDQYAGIVVASWCDELERGELLSVDDSAWRVRFELPYLLWNFALGAAAHRCADGGAIVALVPAPATPDASGWVPELAIADGVLALVRSVAAAEACRGVRANLVTAPLGMMSDVDVVQADSPRGTLDGQVLGAVRTLLATEACGLSGRVLAADGGQSL